MICGSCRRRCDPNRSFCTNCGSSVFIDERDVSAFSGRSIPRVSPTSQASRQLKSLQESAQSFQKSVQSFQKSAQSFDRTAVAEAARAIRARSAAVSSTAPQAFRVGGLIRFAVLVFLLWTAANWLLQIAEVRALKDAIQRGEYSDDIARAASDALLARLDAALGRKPPAATARPAPAERPQRPLVERVPERATAPTETPAGRLLAPARAVTLPPGVSLPGDGVTMPRVLHQVEPTYTTDAIRMKVEGTVVLQAVVRTHGVAADISVVRSLDQRFGLDQQAIAAVRQWRFAPGERNGRPVPVLVRIEITFSLK